MTQQDDKTTMQTNLEWHSATLVEILREQPNAMKGNGGIYIWEHRGKPIYVGKATRKTGLWKRQLQMPA